MERCIITNSYEGSGSFDGRAKLFTIDGIFRYNLMIRNNSCPLIINAYRYKDSPMQMMRRSCLYFNTWHYNQDAAWQMVDMKTPDGSFRPVSCFTVTDSTRLLRSGMVRMDWTTAANS